MKAISLVVIACLSLMPLAARAAETAQVRMYSLSVKVYQGSNIYGDLLKVNSTGNADGDYELTPSQPWDADVTFPGTTDYASQMWIWDNNYQYWSSGTIWLSLPAFTDLNNNRFPDFFEVSRSLSSVTTYGSYHYYDPQLYDWYDGTITAVWSRSANSKTGSCRMTLNDYVLGTYWGTMVATFEIVEYKGPLAFTPGANNVSGSFTLTQTGSNNTFTGSVQFLKSDTNRFDSLILQPGTLTDAALQTYSFTNHYFLRDPAWPTNYAGYVQFDNDGDLSTFYPWAVWVLSITDANDVNHNGVPDFSDDLQVAPRQPLLSLVATSTNLLLTIHGDINHPHQVQTAASLSNPSWGSVLTLTLTNDPVVVPLTKPAGPTFWRVQVQ